jgi:MYXO-CTERM domain-containing protein
MRKQLGFSAALLLSACQLETEIALEEGAIINGEVAVVGDFPAVGALVFDFGGFIQYCTGTLIAPNIVLSAAHCIDPQLNGFDSLDQVAQFTRVVFNQVDVNNGAQAGGVVASVDRIIQNGAFDVNALGDGNDASILVLTQSVAGIQPIPFSTTPANTLIGQRFTAVGFGVSNAANQSGSGIQRFTDFELEAAQGELNFYGQANDTDTGVCFGDSGGPDLISINGVTQVFGIHSFVFDGGSCLGGAGAQRTDTPNSSKFIQDQLDLFGEEEPVVPPVEPQGCGANSVASSSTSASSIFLLLFAFGAFTWRRRSR